MSNNKEPGSPDWDSLLDSLDRQTVTPEVPEHAAKAAPKVPAPPSPRAEAKTSTGEEPAKAPAPRAPAPSAPQHPPARVQRPMASHDDDERTVVGTIPKELLADSVRSGGALGHLIKQRPAKPVETKEANPNSAITTPPPAGDDMDVDMETVDDDEFANATSDESVVTSAPLLFKAARAAVKPPPMPTPATPSAPAESDILDPFADLRPPVGGTNPGVSRVDPSATPKPGAPKPAPRVSAPRAPMGSQPSAGAPTVPLLKAEKKAAAPGGIEHKDSDKTPVPGEGPKLLEPKARQFPADEPTSVFKTDDLALAEIEAAAVVSDSQGAIEVGAAADFDETDLEGIETAEETDDQRSVESVTQVPSGNYEIIESDEPPAPKVAAPAPTPKPAGTPKPPPAKAAPAPRVDLPTRPISLPPPPLPQPEDVHWDDERIASMHLSERGAMDEWVERVGWLEAEARLHEDPLLKARALLAVSELLAMTGEEERAHQLALEVRELAPQLAMSHRQVRSRAIRNQEYAELVTDLGVEVEVAATPEAKVHAQILAAEVSRLVLNNTESAEAQYEAAISSVPADPRAHLAKVAPLVSRAVQPPTYKWPEAAPLEPLADGLHQVAAARGAPEKGPPKSPLDTVARIRKAMVAGDMPAVTESLADLASCRGVGEGALWLASAIGAARKETRTRSIDALSSLTSGPHSVVAMRSLTSRALEQGDQEKAIKHIESIEAFTDAERTSLGALLGLDADTMGPWIHALGHEENLASLGSGLQSFTTPESMPTAGEPLNRSSVAMGRALASGQVTDAIDALAFHAERAPLPWVLRLEEHHSQGDYAHVARTVSSWDRTDGAGQDFERDRALLASFVAETVSLNEDALGYAKKALLLDATSEAAARFCLSLSPNDSSPLLTTAAAHEGARRGLLLLEAAARTADLSERADLLKQAHDASNELPFAASLGLGEAIRANDSMAQTMWLRLRRELFDDQLENAVDQIREARLVGDDPSLAAHLLESAIQAAPTDVPLRETLERTASNAVEPAWKEARIEGVAGVDRARWASTAARDHLRQGDTEGAAKLAAIAVEAGAGLLAKFTRDTADMFGTGASRVSEELIESAKALDSDAAAQREVYERLAYIDEVGRNDQSSSLLWHRAILERTPNHLPSLRKLEHSLISEGRDDELEVIFAEIARNTAGPEAVAHAQVAARLRVRTSSWDTTADLVDVAVNAAAPPGLWALRQQYALARARGDEATVRKASQALSERLERPLDVATLSVRMAESDARTGDLDSAKVLLRGVIGLVPTHSVAHISLAEVLERKGELGEAAEAMEAAAKVSVVASHQCQLYYDAALLWLDKVGNKARGQEALEAVAERDILYASDVFRLLQAMYIENGERVKLAALLEQRLEREEDPAQRAELQVTRGRALAEVGDTDAAKLALEEALQQNPDNIEALKVFVDLCLKLGHYEDAERSLLNLARLSSEADHQADIYYKLGALYEEHLNDIDRAEQSLHEVLKRQPEREDAQEKLVSIYVARGDAAKALETQTGLLAKAKEPPAKRLRTIQMARLYETVGSDLKKAETTLETLRKEFPHDAQVLKALAEFHVRHDHTAAVNVLLDRTASDARRALGSGRFDLNFFANLATVFELRGKQDAAAVAQGTLAALEGHEGSLEGIEMRAANPNMDDLIAPEVLTAGFRTLLIRAGDALDAATPVEPKVLKATAPPDAAAEFVQQVQRAAVMFGFPQINVLVSPSLGTTCMPASSNPATLIFGAALVADTRSDVRWFLTLRALKILQARVSSFSRTAPIDLWPLAAAFLRTLCPTWTPTGVDAKKFAEFQNRIKAHVPANLAPDTANIAKEVVAALGNRASTLQAAANSFGSRCALLATGSMTTALTAISCATGHPQGPPAGAERLTWVSRNAEARDVVVFSVSDAYLDARSR